MKLVTLVMAFAVTLVSTQGFDLPDDIEEAIDRITDINKCDFCPSGSSCIDVNGMKECKCDGSGEIVPPHGYGTSFCDQCGPNQVLREFNSNPFTTAYCVCADGCKWDDTGDNCIVGNPCDEFKCPFGFDCKNVNGIAICGRK